jgi:hypothetical protein
METLVPIQDVPNEVGALRAQIEIRKELFKKMVGCLYRGILLSEIETLRDRLKNVGV